MPQDRNLSNELSGILGQLPGVTQAGPASINSTLYGAPDWSLYAQDPTVQQHIASGRASGYYDDSWTNDAIAQNYWSNVGRSQPGAGPSPTMSNGLLGTINGLQPLVDRWNQESATAQRQGDLADAQSLAGGYDTLKRQLNPELYGLLQQLGNPSSLETEAGNYARANLGPTAGEGYLSRLTGDLSSPDQLESGLYDQATRLLGTGGNLTAQELYQIEQDTRGAYAGRGLYDSNGALGAEILGKDSARRQRMLDNANFASGVSQLRTNRINTAGGLASSLSGVQLQRQQQGLAGLTAVEGLAQGRQGLAAGISSALYSDPYASLGRAPVNSTTVSSVLGQTPDYLSGLLSYGSDLNNTNYNARSASEIASKNSRAATAGAIGSGVVTLGAAAIIAF